MKLAFITLSSQGVKVISSLQLAFAGADADAYVHEAVETDIKCQRFSSVIELTKRVFSKYKGLVYIVPCGAVVRALVGVIESKKTDPAVVALDVGGRYAISLLSGHEGGANELAVQVGNAIGAEPVISTTTEADKNLIVGVGCKRGKGKEEIVTAINSALAEAGVSLHDVRLIASADIKSDEIGLMAAAKNLGVPIRFIPSEEIQNTILKFDESEFVKNKVNLPAVAEPTALLAGRRTQLILKKRKFNGVTVAIAKENCL